MISSRLFVRISNDSVVAAIKAAFPLVDAEFLLLYYTAL